MYAPLYVNTCFDQKRNNVSTLTTKNNTTNTNHKTSHEYTFDSNQIFPHSTLFTQVFPWVWISFEHIGTSSNWPMHTPHHVQTHLRTQTHTHRDSHAHIYTYKLIYAQPSPYINTSVNLNMHAHGLTCPHIYVQNQEHSVPNLFLSFQHIQSIVRVS